MPPNEAKTMPSQAVESDTPPAVQSHRPDTNLTMPPNEAKIPTAGAQSLMPAAYSQTRKRGSSALTSESTIKSPEETKKGPEEIRKLVEFHRKEAANYGRGERRYNLRKRTSRKDEFANLSFDMEPIKKLNLRDMLELFETEEPPNETAFMTTKVKDLDPATIEASDLKEVGQLLNLDVFNFIHKSEIPEGAEILEGMMSRRIKEANETRARDELKSRFVGLGNRQSPDNVVNSGSSSTVLASSVKMALSIAAQHDHLVTVTDIPAAYVQAKQPNGEGSKTKYMKLNTKIVKLMLKIKPELIEYVNQQDGSLYTILARALYGFIDSGLLWYLKLVDDLSEIDFKPLDYDICVFKKDGVEGQICVWVDDLLLTTITTSHRDSIMKHLQSKYPTIKAQFLTKESPVNYIGQKISINASGTIFLDQEQYIKSLANKHGIKSTREYPYDKELFKNDTNSPSLNVTDANLYLSMLMSAMYAITNTQPSGSLSASVLSTRVSRPTQSDAKKLVHLLEYLLGVAHVPMAYRRSNDPENMRLNISADQAFCAHSHNGRGQEGYIARIGENIIDFKSSVSKEVSTSSTQGELITLGKAGRRAIPLREQLRELGYEQQATNIQQDNKSAIHLAKNGRNNASKARHILINAFWITEQIENKTYTLVYCPSETIIADIFTKPIFGARFKQLRNIIYNNRFENYL